MLKIKKSLLKKKTLWIATGACVALLAAAAWWLAVPSWDEWRIQKALAACEPETSADVQNDCVFRIIETEMRTRSVEAAFDVFGKAYERFPNFANGGCHTRSHRMGDVVYYSLYFGKENLDAIDFPQTTTACGYGFYHGFMEHLIQDDPTAEKITETCDYFVGRLGNTMGDIESICYHGAGHGLALAQTERLPGNEWGDAKAFALPPSLTCDELMTPNHANIDQCYEGIFNIMVAHMVLNEYGFSYNTAAPFATCERMPTHLVQPCIYETAMKIDSLAEYDPRKMVEIVSQIIDEPSRLMAFGVGIAGIIQQVVATEGGYQKVLEGCVAVSEPYRENCIGSIAWGLYEHGEPQKEYKKVLAFCAEDTITGETKNQCYQRAAARLPRFYSDEKIEEICREFPAEYRNFCTNTANWRTQPVSATF